MRLAGDVAGTKKAVTDILQLCYDARAWKTLNDQIVLLSKRRGQLKQVVSKPKNYGPNERTTIIPRSIKGYVLQHSVFISEQK